MYYDNVPGVIEADDIVAVRAMQVDAPDEAGCVLAHVTLELSSKKEYTSSPMLHVTNGVNSRLLSPTAPTNSQSSTSIPDLDRSDFPALSLDQGQVGSDESPTENAAAASSPKGKRSVPQTNEAGGGL